MEIGVVGLIGVRGIAVCYPKIPDVVNKQKKRQRYCNNPSPQYGGSYCHGHGTQIHSKTCPLKGKIFII